MNDLKLRIKGIIRHNHTLKATIPPKCNDLMYTIELVCHKKDDQVVNIINHIPELLKTKFSQKEIQAAIAKNKLITPFVDCAIEYPDTPELSDFYRVRLKTYADKSKPTVMDVHRRVLSDPIVERDTVGQYAWVSFYPSAYNQGGNLGVTFYLKGVLLTGENSNLSDSCFKKSESVDEMFGDLLSQETFDNPFEVEDLI